MFLGSVVGIIGPKTMKLLDDIKGTEVIISIDSGATNNFISTSVVQCLGLSCDTCANFGVIMGTGQDIRGQGECKGVDICFQGGSTTINLLVLELAILMLCWEFNGLRPWDPSLLIGNCRQ